MAGGICGSEKSGYDGGRTGAERGLGREVCGYLATHTLAPSGALSAQIPTRSDIWLRGSEDGRMSFEQFANMLGELDGDTAG